MRFVDGLPVYDVGVKVRLGKHQKESGAVVGTNSKMERWYGQVVTISSVMLWNDKFPYYRVEENEWLWDDSLIEGIDDTFCEDDEGEIEDASFGKFFDGYIIMEGKNEVTKRRTGV